MSEPVRETATIFVEDLEEMRRKVGRLFDVERELAQAVNSHQDLVEALRYIVEWRPEGWSVERARELARAALAKARPEGASE